MKPYSGHCIGLLLAKILQTCNPCASLCMQKRRRSKFLTYINNLGSLQGFLSVQNSKLIEPNLTKISKQRQGNSKKISIM